MVFSRWMENEAHMINRIDEPANLRIKLSKGEDGLLLASFRLSLSLRKLASILWIGLSASPERLG